MAEKLKIQTSHENEFENVETKAFFQTDQHCQFRIYLKISKL